jgi:hypothetical protein
VDRTIEIYIEHGHRREGERKEDMEENYGERKHLGCRSWNYVAMRAKDRSEWRGFIHGPILHTESRN